jgi:hypothetical protein
MWSLRPRGCPFRLSGTHNPSVAFRYLASRPSWLVHCVRHPRVSLVVAVTLANIASSCHVRIGPGCQHRRRSLCARCLFQKPDSSPRSRCEDISRKRSNASDFLERKPSHSNEGRRHKRNRHLLVGRWVSGEAYRSGVLFCRRPEELLSRRRLAARLRFAGPLVGSEGLNEDIQQMH